jgi:hypothetical protein
MTVRLLDWIRENSDGEDVEAVIFGEPESFWLLEEAFKKLLPGKTGRVLSLQDARPILEVRFTPNFGGPNVPSMAVYTKSWIIFVAEYDGMVRPERVARRPQNGYQPPLVW